MSGRWGREGSVPSEEAGVQAVGLVGLVVGIEGEVGVGGGWGRVGAADGGAAAIPEGVPPFHGPSEEQVARAQAMWLKEDPGDGGVNIETFMCDATQSLIPTQPALS